jgi:uncharacterized protein (DUF697 family)
MENEQFIKAELIIWQHSMQKRPSLANRSVKSIQERINNIIPEKVHRVFTKAIKEVTRAVLFGAGFTTTILNHDDSMAVTEAKVKDKIRFYSSSASAEGAITGFGGIIWGLADFPLWLSLKMKMLFEIAALYGINVNNLSERIYILHIFQITFSSQKNRNRVYGIMKDWDKNKEVPTDIHQFDWRRFQLEYRDHIDLAKLLQLIPGFGAIIGAYINLRLTRKLGKFAMNAYRMRLLDKPTLFLSHEG